MSEAAVPTADAPEISAVGAFVGVFSQPGRTFERLMKSPTWWLPLVLFLAVVFGSGYFVKPKIDFDRSFHEMFEKRSIPEDKLQEMITKAEAAPPVKTGLQGVAIWLALFFLIGLIFWGALKAFGAEASFPQTLAVWSHANLANAAGTLVSIPLFLQLPDSSITQSAVGHYVKSSLGAFLPESLGPFAISFASSIDVFSLAAIALLVVGFRRVPGLGKGAAMAVPLSLWGLYVLGKATLAALFFG